MEAATRRWLIFYSDQPAPAGFLLPGMPMLTQLSQPSAEPLSLAEAKLHLVEDAFAAIYLTAPAASAEPPAKRAKKQTETDK